MRFLQRLRESTGLISSPSKSGSRWRVVLIETGFSKNRSRDGRQRYYPESALRRAFREGVFEGTRIKAFRYGQPVIGGSDEFNHLDRSGRKSGKDFAENIIGYSENVRYEEFRRPDGSTGEGLTADLVILKGAKALRENMVDAWEQGKHDLYGLSIEAGGMARPGVVDGLDAEIVEHLVEASSTDIVSEPAAGGSLLRLAASQGSEDSMDPKKLIELIESTQPAMLKGIPSIAAGQDPADYLTHVCESNLAVAKRKFLGARGRPRSRPRWPRASRPRSR